MEVKISQVLDAMEKNGYPQIKGILVTEVPRSFGPFTLKPKIEGACAIGQAALNLGVRPRSLQYALSSVYVSTPSYHTSLADRIVSKNDLEGVPVRQIARELRNEIPAHNLDRTIFVVKK